MDEQPNEPSQRSRRSTRKGEHPRPKDRTALDAAELNHMCNRLEDLGATREQTDLVRATWPTATDEQRMHLIATNDLTLEAAIAEANAVDEFHEVAEDPLEPDVRELMAAVAPYVETWGPRQLLNDWVKGDPTRARALLHVERAGRNRTSLVRVLTELAGDA